MFLGEYSHALDAKGRLTVPARLRGELGEGLVLTRGYDPCIFVYPPAEWAALAQKIAAMSVASQTARSYGRLMFGGAFETNLDRLGRVLIPSFLREYAGIKDEAVVVGVNTYLEIWNPGRWSEVVARDGGNLPAILDDMVRMGV